MQDLGTDYLPIIVEGIVVIRLQSMCSPVGFITVETMVNPPFTGQTNACPGWLVWRRWEGLGRYYQY